MNEPFACEGEPLDNDRRSFVKSGLGLLGGLTMFMGADALGQTSPDLIGLTPPFGITVLGAEGIKTADGVELRHTISGTGGNGVKALTTAFSKRVEYAEGYHTFTEIGIQYFPPGSETATGHANFVTVVYGTKGTVSGNQRIGDKLDVIVLADGKFAGRVSKLVNVQLDAPHLPMGVPGLEKLYREAIALRLAQQGGNAK